MKNKKLLFVLLGFVAVLGLAALLYPRLTARYTPQQAASGQSEAPEGSGTETDVMEAPDFTVLDLDGEEVSLSDYFDKPVVVNFWATWCGPCKSELPAFDAVYQDYKDEVHFLMVNMTDGTRETVDGVKAFVSEGGYTFPVYFDTQQDAAGTYGVYSIPATLFVQQDGGLIGGYIGAMEEQTLREYLDALIAGELRAQ